MSDDLDSNTSLIYLHGFKSSPRSQKALSLIDYAQNELIDWIDQGKLELLVPTLPYKPEQAVALIEKLILSSVRPVLIGSSLGGFYSIYFAEKFNCKAVLVNPLVTLQESLADSFLGHHTNLYNGDEFDIEISDAEYLMTLERANIVQQDQYLLLLETGDEVLDYRKALEKFPKAEQVVIAGGNHRFENFEKYLTKIIEFVDLKS
ncbi:MAG: YqiA/YcfP family alpha/beta fold hydrolase [Pseudohongiellaceae bacterium]